MRKFIPSLVAGAMCFSLYTTDAAATVVTLDTNVGEIKINLFDATTPATVENFLTYVNEGSYNNTFIHRSVPDFVVQGGGLSYGTGAEAGFEYIASSSPVVNEPKLSNVRATIAMAKSASGPDTATNQFFFNLIDNSANLDAQNGGFTVFGHIDEDSMAVIDTVATYSRFNLNGFSATGALGEVPLKDYTSADAAAGTIPGANNFIIINNATVTDAATDTAAGLNPAANPNYNANSGGGTGGGTSGGSSSSGGGGSFGAASIALLGLLGLRRRKA